MAGYPSRGLLRRPSPGNRDGIQGTLRKRGTHCLRNGGEACRAGLLIEHDVRADRTQGLGEMRLVIGTELMHTTPEALEIQRAEPARIRQHRIEQRDVRVKVRISGNLEGDESLGFRAVGDLQGGPGV